VDSVQVIVLALPEISINVPTATCEGTPNTLTAISNQAIAYVWSNNTTSASATVLQAGEYAVTITDQSGCTATASASITFNQPDQTSLTLRVCPGASVEYNNTILFGGEVKEFQFVNGFGCDSVVTVTVQEVALPPVDLGADTTLSAPISYVLNAGPGYTSYQWNTGATTSFVIINQPGTYAVTVTNSIGCSDTDEIVVQQSSSSWEPASNWVFSASPNPTSGLINIQLAGLESDHYSLEVLDITGKLIYSTQLGMLEHTGAQSVDLSGMPSGMYLLKLRSATAYKTLRIIVE
jgi:hypothetical protein